jgi:hypothetical protein
MNAGRTVASTGVVNHMVKWFYDKFRHIIEVVGHLIVPYIGRGHRAFSGSGFERPWGHSLARRIVYPGGRLRLHTTMHDGCGDQSGWTPSSQHL